MSIIQRVYLGASRGGAYCYNKTLNSSASIASLDGFLNAPFLLANTRTAGSLPRPAAGLWPGLDRARVRRSASARQTAQGRRGREETEAAAEAAGQARRRGRREPGPAPSHPAGRLCQAGRTNQE